MDPRRAIRMHMVLASMGTGIVLAAVLYMSIVLEYGGASHMRHIHSYVGVLALSTGIAAMIAGLRTRKRTTNPLRTRMVHRFLGRAAITMMFLAALMGLSIIL